MCGQADELERAMQDMSEQDRRESELKLVCVRVGCCSVLLLCVTVLRAHDVQLCADKDAMLERLSSKVCVRASCLCAVVWP